MAWTPCVVHTIQLLVHMLQKDTTVRTVLDKARSVVKLFYKSSVATQRLLDQCGVIVVNDCPTRWSSTSNMVTRLLTVKDAVCQITNDMGWDSLLTSEWQKLPSLHDLLLPFAEHTKTLQSDTTSMSLVVPALFDLLSHLTDFAENTRYRDLAILAKKMSSRCLGSSQNAASQGLNRKPPQPASGSRSSSTRKNLHIPSLRTQEQTSGWKRVTVFITV